jgi:squalene synthase HpnC
MTAPELDAAHRSCLERARDHYENFPTASRLLKAEIRPAVAAIYAFAREADDFADEPEFEGRRLELLDSWERALDEAVDGRPEGAVFVALRDAIERHRLPVQPLRDLLDAFRQDVTVSRYESFEEVLDYCTRSANPVGRLVLALHGERSEARLQQSDAVCTGLQLTNFWQDVAVDLDKDRVYLPLEDLRRFELSEEKLFGRAALPAFRRLLAFQLERTRRVFAPGWPLVSERRGRLGLWLRLVWGGGHRVIERLERSGCDPFEHRPRLGARDWASIATPALLGLTRPRPPARIAEGLP